MMVGPPPPPPLHPYVLALLHRPFVLGSARKMITDYDLLLAVPNVIGFLFSSSFSSTTVRHLATMSPECDCIVFNSCSAHRLNKDSTSLQAKPVVVFVCLLLTGVAAVQAKPVVVSVCLLLIGVAAVASAFIDLEL